MPDIEFIIATFDHTYVSLKPPKLTRIYPKFGQYAEDNWLICSTERHKENRLHSLYKVDRKNIYTQYHFHNY